METLNKSWWCDRKETRLWPAFYAFEVVLCRFLRRDFRLLRPFRMLPLRSNEVKRPAKCPVLILCLRCFQHFLRLHQAAVEASRNAIALVRHALNFYFRLLDWLAAGRLRRLLAGSLSTTFPPKIQNKKAN